MRPPAQRNFVGVATQVRPKFGSPSGPMPAPIRAYSAPESKDSLMAQSCIRGHEKNSLPLLDANRFRSKDPPGDYSRGPPRPKLPRRPNLQAPILVKTWE
jgi:hypothetical protein